MIPYLNFIPPFDHIKLASLMKEGEGKRLVGHPDALNGAEFKARFDD